MKPYDAVNCATIFRFVFITMITYTAEKLRIIGLSYGEIARRSFTSLIYIYIYIYIYTGCHRRNGPNFGRVFLMLNYTDITQNTYIQS